MRQSKLFLKTLKGSPKDEQAVNASLLMRAGFAGKIGAGIYAYLPLGLRVIRRIEHIVREEMEAIGGRELLMPALHPKEYWVKTGRWEDLDALYKIKAREDREYALGATHEEIIVSLAKNIIQSYKDLPFYLYQIQTKFRDEPRAKSGLLRGREFIMKDLYSFHTDESDLATYYECANGAYENVFARCGLDAIRTKADGGTFSKFSDEYQVVNPAGEDIIFSCRDCAFARNKEVIGDIKSCPECGKTLKEDRASEVGNIFKLGKKFSEPFNLTYQDKKGNKKPVLMGCYGIGISRLMATIVEIHHDDKGLMWPEHVAPFRVHLLDLTQESKGKSTYEAFQKANMEVLYDDRKEVAAGQKMVEADLLGIPWRIVVSDRTKGKLEVKKREEEESKLYTLKEFTQKLEKN
jgi:prolyl-tRNA synthetase